MTPHLKISDPITASPDSAKDIQRRAWPHPGGHLNQNHNLDPAAPHESPMSPADPRWVLAVRTGESLQGPILGPEQREKLLRLGKVLGLRPFDCNLIIAIVQDQARQGLAPRLCPAAGQDQLRMVPLPATTAPRQRALNAAYWIAGALVAELFIVAWWLGSLSA